MEPRQRHTDSHSNANCDAHADANGNANSHASTGRRRLMRSGLEFDPCLLQYVHHLLQWRKHGQQERLELYCAILEPGSGPDHRRQRRSGRHRRSVVYWREVLERHAYAYSHSDCDAQPDGHTHAASGRQRDLRGI